MKLNYILGTLFLLFVLFLLFNNNIEKYKNMSFDNIKNIKDFDKNIIQLDKLKFDKSNIKNFKPKKTSNLKLFCSQSLDSPPTCYRQ